MGFGADIAQDDQELAAAQQAASTAAGNAQAAGDQRKSDVMSAFDWDLNYLRMNALASFDQNVQTITSQVQDIQDGTNPINSITLGGSPSPTFTYAWGTSMVITYVMNAYDFAGNSAGNMLPQIDMQLAYIANGLGASAVPVKASGLFINTLLGRREARQPPNPATAASSLDSSALRNPVAKLSRFIKA